jgi:uncharacterized RDD family membrane protein YckC
MPGRASFQERLIAGLIDFGILIAISLVLNFTVGFLSAYLAQLLMFVAVFAVILFPEATKGQSIGKRLRGLIIRGADGQPAAGDVLRKRVIIKSIPTIVGIVASVLALVSLVSVANFVNIVSGLAGLALFVGCFLALKPERQTLHDQLAETAVYPVAQE